MTTHADGAATDDATTDDATTDDATTGAVDEDTEPKRDLASPGDWLRSVLASGSGEPFYPRVLRLKNLHPNGWQRAALFEGTIVLGVLAALADRATSWAPLILPVVTAVVVKFNDLLVGLLPRRPAPETPNGGAAREDDAAVGEATGKV